MPTAVVTSKYTSSERRVEKDWTLDDLKKRLELITGIPVEAQVLRVYNPSGQALKPQPGNHLSDVFGFEDNNYRIHVEDSRPANEQLNLDEDVDKYEMSQEDYEKRKNSVLEWKKSHGLGRFGPAATQQQESWDPALTVGARCTCTLTTGSCGGTIKFIGKVAEIPGNGTWFGVQLDEERGKNDGSIRGTRYFESPQNYGVFVKPAAVSTETVESDDEI